MLTKTFRYYITAHTPMRMLSVRQEHSLMPEKKWRTQELCEITYNREENLVCKKRKKKEKKSPLTLLFTAGRSFQGIKCGW